MSIEWLAGIIDGEGCVGVYPCRSGQYSQPVVVVGNTDEGIIAATAEAFREVLGVAPEAVKVIPKKPSQRSVLPWWEVKVTRQADVKLVLAAVIPYLRSVKKQRAQLVLETLNNHTKGTSWRKA